MVNNKKTPRAAIGVVSLMVIFAVLCLTIFSVMALSTAAAEKNFAQKRASAQQNYYKAEAKCAKIANSIGALWEEKSEEDIISFLQENSIEYKKEDGSLTVLYDCSIDENQILSVEISLSNTFEINRWQVVSIGDWTPDDTIDVWSGETDF